MFQCWPISDLFQATIKQPEPADDDFGSGLCGVLFLCLLRSENVNRIWQHFFAPPSAKNGCEMKIGESESVSTRDSPNSVIMKAVILATLVGACVYRNRRRGSAMTLDGSAVSQPSPFHLQLLHGRSYRWRSCGFVVNFIHFYD